MHAALRNDFTVKMRQFFKEPNILQKLWAFWLSATGQPLLVVSFFVILDSSLLLLKLGLL